MAERVALLHAVSGRKARGKVQDTPWYRRGPAVEQTAAAPDTGSQSAAEPAAESAARSGTKKKAVRRTAAKPAAKPAAASAATSASRPRLWQRQARTGAAEQAGEPAGEQAPRRPRRPAPPVLQRGSLGSVLARAAVMALALVCMIAFAVALAKVTLVPSPASVHLIHTNLRPGASIRAYLDQPALRDIVKQIGGNILLGVPFGILLPMLFPRARGLLRVLVITAVVMLMVESVQGAIVEGRAFDIDDVILNTTGALLGYLLLGRRLGRALHPRRSHWWHRYGFGDPEAAGVTRDRRPARKRP